MTAVRMALAPLAVLFAGLGVVKWAFTSTGANRSDGWLQWPIALAVGMGLWSSAYTALLLAVGSRAAVMLAKDGLLVVVGAGLWHTASSTKPLNGTVATTEAGPRWMIRLLATSLVVAALLAPMVFVIRVLRTPDGFWDAWAIWNLRARFLVRAPNALMLAFSPQLGWNSHPDYPLLLPGLTAQVWTIVGHESPVVPPIIAGVFACIAVAVLMCGVMRLRGAVNGLVAALVLLGTSAFLRMATQQVADVPLGTFSLIAAVVAVAATTERSRRLFWLAGLVASMGMWTKNEGTLHAVALIAAIALFQARTTPISDRVRSVAWFVLGALPIFIMMLYFKLSYAPPNDLVKDTSLIDSVHRLLTPVRYGTVVGELLQRVYRVNDWNGFLFLLPLLAIGWGRRVPVHSGARMAMAFSLLVLAGFAFVYVLTPRDLEWHLQTSLDRVLMQWWPSFIFATFLVLPGPESG